jgi:hypothetical protein
MAAATPAMLWRKSAAMRVMTKVRIRKSNASSVQPRKHARNVRRAALEIASPCYGESVGDAAAGGRVKVVFEADPDGDGDGVGVAPGG